MEIASVIDKCAWPDNLIDLDDFLKGTQILKIRFMVTIAA